MRITTLEFDIDGEAWINFEAKDYVECATQDEFESALVEDVESRTSWGLRPRGFTYETLWAEVVKARDAGR